MDQKIHGTFKNVPEVDLVSIVVPVIEFRIR
jgi:hypothetical protein